MGPGASHGLIASLDALAARPGHQLTYPMGWALGERKRAANATTPGARLTLFEAVDGWRYSLWVTNLPARTPGWRGQPAYIDAAHRVPRNTPPRARPVLRPGRRGPGTVAQHPGHDDLARPPLVPVRAPLRVVPGPPVRTPHPHNTIGTRVLNRTASRQS